jgi:hypothetical protein
VKIGPICAQKGSVHMRFKCGIYIDNMLRDIGPINAYHVDHIWYSDMWSV